MDHDSATDRLTGEEAPEDVPSEAADGAENADRRVDRQHETDDPDAPTTES